MKSNLIILIVLLCITFTLIACTANTESSNKKTTNNTATSELTSDNSMIISNNNPKSVSISKTSIFQVLEIPILENDNLVISDNREIPIIADRMAKIVTYLNVPDNWKENTVEVRIDIINDDITTTYSAKTLLKEKSIINDLSTSIQIDVPAEVILPTSSYIISVWEKDFETPSVRIPATGELALGAIKTGPIKIQLIPYEINGYTPSVSQDIIDGYRDAVYAIYPTSEVIITVGDVRPFWTNDVGEVIVDVGVAQEESEEVDVYFIGLVSGVANRSDFEGSTGTSEEGGMDNVPDRAFFAVVAAFGDAKSTSTLTHELGHLHMLMHAPSGNPPDTDPLYPSPEGLIDTIGYDYRTNTFIDSTAYDLMGYSQPRWISEYHYIKLVKHILLSQTWEQ